MSKIRILPEQLANRIAAGEVVERPASVVKELLENSLDAGATRIEVEIEGSGTRLIRIIDNGCGMDEDDLLLCLERHGTSKISSGEDLDAITSLGFRGEAIPSIGSVARMNITSRLPDAALGATVVQEYGKLIQAHEVGCNRGTTFEIRNLFGNTPARKKFLRSSRTELAHIEEVIKAAALAAPTTAFVLRVDEREVLHFDTRQGVAERLRAILHYQGPLMELGHVDERDETAAPYPSVPTVRGWLTPPDAAVAGSALLRLLVNGRSVRDRRINHAVSEGLRNFLMKGRIPAGLLLLRLPPGDVDVNVHPTKQEIRLRDSQAIHHLITRSVETAMEKYQQTLQGKFFQTPAMTPPSSPRTDLLKGSGEQTGVMVVQSAQAASVARENRPVVTTRLAPEMSFSSPVVHTSEPMPSEKLPLPQQNGAQITRPQPDRQRSQQPIPATHTVAVSTSRIAEPVQTASVSPLAAASPRQSLLPIPETQGHGLQIIGQYDNLYIFCRAADGGLLVIDQHAAHERLLFEELKKQFGQGRVVSQSLLFPATVELSAAEMEQAERHLATLRQMGFEIREFGGSTFVISAIPAMAGQCDPGALFRDLLRQFSYGADVQGVALLDDILASMACKAAVKAGNQLQTKEMEELLNRMARADLFSHCPHGRPVLKHFSANEVKKWFYRP